MTTIRALLVALTLALAAVRCPWPLIIAADLAAYAAWAYFHPFRPCPRCRGTGNNRLSTKRRSGPCRRCDGRRQVQTLGSRTLHRAVRGAVSYRRSARKDK